MSNNVTYLKDYRPLDWIIKHVDLEFNLDADTTIVTAKLHMQCQGDRTQPVVLFGENLTTIEIKIDGIVQNLQTLSLDAERLILKAPEGKEQCIIETTVEIHPNANTKLMGLYQSSVILCTQCEAEGFRRITWFTDRPDVLATWNVKLIGDKATYPILLSNGDCVEKGDLAEGKHYAIWQDPHPKPSYLFAIACGVLGHLQDSFITKAGKEVSLNIWVMKGNEDRAKWSMECLKHAMAWEEETYNLQYDLGQFNIVSVPDFNMGAMENKSLNIFNDGLFLANNKLATDKDFERIDTVIAHEYFHNWTGNRITCRDWFQLSLKEGLTVFRDQQYTEDRYIRTSARMEQVHILRNAQFKEDAGNLSHPVRPDSFVDISNFYTVTIYEKGAEVIRMLYNLLGAENYYKGIALYIERHDGKAVTVEDFIQSFEDACNMDLSQFFLWYTQRGTPKVELKREVSENGIKLHFTQILNNTTEEQKKPQYIPIKLAGLDPTGKEIIAEQVVILDDWQNSFYFEGNFDNVIISWNRDFSAPIHISDDLSFDERLFLAQYDANIFNRSDAFFQSAIKCLIHRVNGQDNQAEYEKLAAIITSILQADDISLGEKSALLQLPNAGYINQQLPVFAPEATEKSLKELRYLLAKTNHQAFKEAFHKALSLNVPDDLSPKMMEKRSFANMCLSYLSCLNDADILSYLKTQLKDSNASMTLRAEALRYAVNYHEDALEDAINSFLQEFENEPLVCDKYFMIKSAKTTDNPREVLDNLMKHPQFTMNNPNRVRSVLGGFCANPANLHRKDGLGYAILCGFLAQLDGINSEGSARICKSLAVKNQLDTELKQHLITHLNALKANTKSKQLHEVIDGILQ